MSVNNEISEGFKKERFSDKNISMFDCIICFNQAKKPQQCLKCGIFLCTDCLCSWKRNNTFFSCLSCESTNFGEISSEYKEIYDNLLIKCKYCYVEVLMKNLENHENSCSPFINKNCINYDICFQKVRKEYFQHETCSNSCILLAKIRKTNGNWKIALEEIKDFVKKQRN